MNMLEKIKKYQNLTTKELNQLLQNKEELLNMSILEFNTFFLNINNENKKEILNDIDLFKKVITLPKNRMKKTILDLIDTEIKEYIYNHQNLLQNKEYLQEIQYHLEKLSKEELSKLLNNENLNQAFEDIITKKYENLTKEINNKTISPLALLSIKNKEELFIYQKFNILVNVEKKEEDYLIIDSKKISYSFLEKVNKKHLNNLLEENKKNTSNNKLFITITKLYMIFGLDNTKKILNNFFTYPTKSSLDRSTKELFNDIRREHRIKNQEIYYYYGIEDKTLEELQNNNISYFKKLTKKDEEYALNLMNKIKQTINIKSFIKRNEKIKKIIEEEIEKRDKHFQELGMKKIKSYFNSLTRKKDITIEELYDLFSEIDCEYKLTKDGKIIPNETLIKVILGNSKRDNDCLLRMVLNKGAFGLNQELYQIINHFNEIEKITKNSNQLSIYSISDIIDISKVFLYNLKPDELDITLETLSKILNSRKYCTEKPEIILERVMNLHKKRKEKISCAIPFVEGNNNEINYRVLKPREEFLLACGIDAESCFKIGGKGEDFFNFCLTNPLGLIIEIEYNEKKYILPASINGNMLNINSIDPKIKDSNIYNSVINTLKEISNILFNTTKNIELITITDIHHKELTKSLNLEKINITEFIPLNTDIYNDYNKKEVTNYIIDKKNIKAYPKYYNNKERFLIERFNPYIISSTHEYDKEKTEQIINEIAYTNSKEEKKKNYTPLKVEDFKYIIGNIDWFIGIKKDNTIIRHILSYDTRSTDEYNTFYKIIEEIINNPTNQKKKIKKL